MSYDPYSLGKLMVRSEHFEFSRRFLRNFKEHIEIKETAGRPLIICAFLALVWCNLAFPETYHLVWGEEIILDLGILQIGGHLKHIVNDLLLPLFFFVVGLEIKHELVRGELSSLRRAAMPLAVAAGGMALPAAIYLALNLGGGAPEGWGIPVATDVAFALAVLSLFGDRIPHNLKVLTMAFAAADDMGGVLVIALFYTESITVPALLAAAALYAVMLLLLRYRVFGAYIIYTMLGFVFFLALLKSGVHTTIAGVLLGLAVPSNPVFRRDTFDEKIGELARHFDEAHRKRKKLLSGPEPTHDERIQAHKYMDREQVILGKIDELVRGTESPCTRLRRMVTPFVNYIVLPVFALANAGVVITADGLSRIFTSDPAWGIVLGLVAGKPAGILAAAWTTNRLGLADLPDNVGWRHMTGMALLAGIGFTVSLFIADLAFRGAELLPAAKASVLAASILAALAGGLYLAFALPRNKTGQ
jgi:NhaA family Na+:H+ antiporter